MKDIVDIFERPFKFFGQNRSFGRAFAHFLLAAAVFVALNELMIMVGLVPVERKFTGLESIAINFASLVAGYFAITAVSFAPLAAMGKRNYTDFFVVTAYSLTPLIFFWIPHLLPQAIVVIWSIMLMVIGTSQKMKISYRKSAIPVVVFIALTIIFSVIFGNYILVPLNRL